MKDTQTQLKLEALKYLEWGLSVFPVSRDKKPILKSWKEFQTRRPTKDEIENWFFDYNPDGIAIVTGKVSGIVVLDVEKDGDTTGLDIPTTPTVKTGGGGYHYYFKHPQNGELKNLTRFRDLMDFRGDGGYVLAPPSLHKSGNRYEWSSDFDETELADIPKWLFAKEEDIPDKKSKPTNKKLNDWGKMQLGVDEGSRHDTATRLAGKLLCHMPEKDWNDFILPFLQDWNDKNIPPLESKELEDIYYSLAEKQRTQRLSKGNTKSNVGDFTEQEDVDLIPVSLNDLLTRELPDIEWTIDQLIPEASLVMLSAPPAHHKTWVALYFAIQVACGELVFDRFSTKKCNVLFIEEDSSDRLITQRVQKLQPDKSSSILFLTRCGIKLENKRTMEKLVELIKKENIKFVVLDSLIQLHNQDENMNKDMARVFDPLKDLNDIGVSVLVLHHHRKETGSEDSMSWKDRSQSLRGASSILSLLNSSLVIHRQSQHKSVLRQTKLWEREEMNPLEFEVTDDGDKVVVRYIGELEPEKDKKTLVRENVLEILKEEHLTRSELVGRLKEVASQSYVASVIAEMKRSGEIIVTKKTGKKGRIEVYGLSEDDPDFDDDDNDNEGELKDDEIDVDFTKL